MAAAEVAGFEREQGIDLRRAMLAVVIALLGIAGVIVAAGFRPGDQRR